MVVFSTFQLKYSYFYIIGTALGKVQNHISSLRLIHLIMIRWEKNNQLVYKYEQANNTIIVITTKKMKKKTGSKN